MDFGGDEDDGDDDGGDDGDEDGGVAGGQDQSTGRWTKKEHELFLAALKKYGKVTSHRRTPQEHVICSSKCG